MVDEVKLAAEVRKDFSGSRINELRNEGLVPAIIYGPDIKENIPIIIDKKEFKAVISTEHGENALIKLSVKGKKAVTTIVKEIQVHPVSMNILHVDFSQIKLTEKVEVEVPLEVVGEAIGVKDEGGILEHIIRKVKVRCLPTDIPGHFELDVSELGVGSGLKIADISVPGGVELIDDPESLAINLVMPKEEPEPVEGEVSEEPEEPEVIGKEGKEAKETEEEAPASKEPQQKEEQE